MNKIPNIQELNGPWGGNGLYVNDLPIFTLYKLKINNRYFIYYTSYPLKGSNCPLAKQKSCKHFQVETGEKTTGIIETDKNWKSKNLNYNNSQTNNSPQSDSPG